jgi:hypothetical protein
MKQEHGMSRVSPTSSFIVRRWPEVAIIIATSLVLSLVGVYVQLSTAPIAEAACIGHCYGIVKWPNAIDGASTRFFSETLSGNSSYHISNELWLIDTSHGCSGNSGSWVEAGEATRLSPYGVYYFWAECRPGSAELDHFQYVVPSGDYSQRFTYYIQEGNPSTILVAMFNSSGTEPWNGVSTSNSMAPNLIEAGLESTNTSQTSAAYNYFSLNQWQDGSGIWHYQTNGGSISQNMPPYFSWSAVPAPGNNGGNGQTHCC